MIVISTKMKEVDYIQGLLTHDRKVIATIYQEYAPRIQHLVLNKGGTIADARDIFQDALMNIYHKAQKEGFELTSQFYTYLYGICHFVWDRKSKKKANNTVTIPVDNRYKSEENIEAALINRERQKIFQDSFAQLGTFCQQILQLFYDRKSMTEITEQLKLKNEHTARNRKYRCQKELENLIKSDTRYASYKVKKMQNESTRTH